MKLDFDLLTDCCEEGLCFPGLDDPIPFHFGVSMFGRVDPSGVEAESICNRPSLSQIPSYCFPFQVGCSNTRLP